MMRYADRVAGVIAFVLLIPSAALSQRVRLPFDFGSATVVGEDALLERPIAASIAPGGGIVIADFSSHRIIKFNAAGRLEWRVGRTGQGPGEYTAPMRVTVLPDGTVLVYDAGRSGLTRLRPNGAFRDVVQLDVEFDDIDNIVALGSGGIAISGIVRSGSSADTNYAVHIFDANFHHIRSFGPLPAVRNRAVLPMWGAGGLSVGRGETLVYTRRYPYEIYRYNLSGALLGVVRPALSVVGSPEEAIRINANGARVSYTNSPKVTRLAKAYELPDGRILAGRLHPNGNTIDLLGADGSVIGVRDGWPAHWASGLAAFDVERNTLWVFGEAADVPVLLRYSLAGERM
jgi:hypothetical protein